MTRWAYCLKVGYCFVCHKPGPFWYTRYDRDRPVGCRHA